MAGQLGHGGHEGTGPHVAGERVLGRGVELLLEGDGLQGGETPSHVVDDRYVLRLSRGETCGWRKTPRLPKDGGVTDINFRIYLH